MGRVGSESTWYDTSWQWDEPAVCRLGMVRVGNGKSWQCVDLV